MENKLNEFLRNKHEWIYPLIFAVFYYILLPQISNKKHLEYHGVYGFIIVSVVFIIITTIANSKKKRIKDCILKESSSDRDSINALMNDYIMLYYILLSIISIYIRMMIICFLMNSSFTTTVIKMIYGDNAYLEGWILVSCIIEINTAKKIKNNNYY